MTTTRKTQDVTIAGRNYKRTSQFNPDGSLHYSTYTVQKDSGVWSALIAQKHRVIIGKIEQVLGKAEL